MINKILILIISSIWVSCGLTDNKSKNESEKQEIISTSNIKFDTLNHHPLLPKIEHENVKKWFSTTIDKYYLESGLYFSGLYIEKKKVNNISIIVTYFSSDDLSKCYLLTVDQSNNLIDIIDVAEEYEHFYEDSISYIEIEGTIETEIVSETEYRKFEQEKIKYFTGNHLDSISNTKTETILTILNDGTIQTKKDKNVP